mmetsp:Transcript_70613/g.199359  ORF Transcript_70613/g.199359 Transcript_70613/m.199359 type:complete len:235 (+) Transcript_70613:2827-3531(+)
MCTFGKVGQRDEADRASVPKHPLPSQRGLPRPTLVVLELRAQSLDGAPVELREALGVVLVAAQGADDCIPGVEELRGVVVGQQLPRGIQQTPARVRVEAGLREERLQEHGVHLQAHLLVAVLGREAGLRASVGRGARRLGLRLRRLRHRLCCAGRRFSLHLRRVGLRTGPRCGGRCSGLRLVRGGRCVVGIHGRLLNRGRRGLGLRVCRLGGRAGGLRLRCASQLGRLLPRLLV